MRNYYAEIRQYNNAVLVLCRFLRVSQFAKRCRRATRQRRIVMKCPTPPCAHQLFASFNEASHVRYTWRYLLGFRIRRKRKAVSILSTTMRELQGQDPMIGAFQQFKYKGSSIFHPVESLVWRMQRFIRTGLKQFRAQMALLQKQWDVVATALAAPPPEKKKKKEVAPKIVFKSKNNSTPAIPTEAKPQVIFQPAS